MSYVKINSENLKTKYFKSKDVIELLEWDTIVEEVMKGKVLDPEAEKV